MGAPRLPSSFEFRILRAACGLPPWLGRLLFGAPARVDGQVLAADVRTTLRLADWSGSNTLTDGLPPAQARAFNAAAVAATGGPLPPVAEVRELAIPGPGGALPAKLLLPPGAPQAPRPLLIFFPGGGWVIGGFYCTRAPAATWPGRPRPRS